MRGNTTVYCEIGISAVPTIFVDRERRYYSDKLHLANYYIDSMSNGITIGHKHHEDHLTVVRLWR